MAGWRAEPGALAFLSSKWEWGAGCSHRARKDIWACAGPGARKGREGQPGLMGAGSFGLGVPNLLAADRCWSGPVRHRATQQEGSWKVMRWSHPETIPLPLVHGKIVFHETSPWCQQGQGPRLRVLLLGRNIWELRGRGTQAHSSLWDRRLAGSRARQPRHSPGLLCPSLRSAARHRDLSPASQAEASKLPRAPAGLGISLGPPCVAGYYFSFSRWPHACQEAGSLWAWD